MLALLLVTCTRSREQITSVLWGSFPRRFTFEVVCLLFGLTWKANIEDYYTKALFLSLATAAENTRF